MILLGNCSGADDILLNIKCKLEGQPLPEDSVHDAPGIVISQSSAEFLISHSRFVLVIAPELGDSLRVHDAKLVSVARPLDYAAVVRS